MYFLNISKIYRRCKFNGPHFSNAPDRRSTIPMLALRPSFHIPIITGRSHDDTHQR